MLEKIIAFTVGAGIGSVLTYYFVKDRFAEMARDEINAMKEYYDGKVEKAERENKELKVQIEKSNEPEQERTPTGSVEEYKDYIHRSKNYTSYESVPLSKSVDIPKNIVESVPDPTIDFSPNEEDDNVYEITKGMYDGDETYIKANAVYYIADKALATEADEILDTKDTIDDMGYLFEDNPDREVIYIRNEYERTDYEIRRDPRSFKVDILGEEDD